MRKLCTLFLFPLLLLPTTLPAATHTTFSPADGTFLVNNHPFFPLGIWTYNINSDVLADLREHHFNTVVGNGFSPPDLPSLEKFHLMIIPMATPDWLNAAQNSDSLLAWYLTDEPEEHNLTPDAVHKLYTDFKSKDPHHPLGITHDTDAGPPKYLGSADFTMTDIYPVTKDRSDRFPLSAVGQHIDNARAAHHDPHWPNLAFVQTFGGPDTDSGAWAQPLPHEVRFMAFNALVHHANGILYFSYWPRSPQTWSSITSLNHDLQRLIPYLLSPGTEVPATSSNPAIELRARHLTSGPWLILATNNTPIPQDTTLTIPTLPDQPLRMPFDSLTPTPNKSSFPAHFSPHETHTYLQGPDPTWPH